MLYRKNSDFKFITGEFDIFVKNKNFTIDDYIKKLVADNTPENKTADIVETTFNLSKDGMKYNIILGVAFI